MEVTRPGSNRTGAAASPKDIALMIEAVNDLSPLVPISTLRIDEERQDYIAKADSVGSVPPTSTRGRAKKASSRSAAASDIFLDKLGERIAFERTGTRLYSALITKYLALLNAGQDALPPVRDEEAIDTLNRIRNEELQHFHMLCDAMSTVGGDPTAQTPCADVAATASMGLMQVITDPRTTLAQCLNTILTAELTDNAGWELLSDLAQQADQMKMAEQFAAAIETEQQHLMIVRGWLQELLVNEVGTPAV